MGKQCHLCHTNRIKLIYFQPFLLKQVIRCLNFLSNFFHPSFLSEFSSVFSFAFLKKPNESFVGYWLLLLLLFFVVVVMFLCLFLHVVLIQFTYIFQLFYHLLLHLLVFWFNLSFLNNSSICSFMQWFKTNKLLVFIFLGNIFISPLFLNDNQVENSRLSIIFSKHF